MSTCDIVVNGMNVFLQYNFQPILSNWLFQESLSFLVKWLNKYIKKTKHCKGVIN